MPVSERTISRWICDRCGTKQEFPDESGRVAEEIGWLKFDLGRSLVSTLKGTNEQVLCPVDVDKLALWFKTDHTPAAASYNQDEELRYNEVMRGRTGGA